MERRLDRHQGPPNQGWLFLDLLADEILVVLVTFNFADIRHCAGCSGLRQRRVAVR